MAPALMQAIPDGGLSPAEGAALFARAVIAGHAHVFVSCEILSERIVRHRAGDTTLARLATRRASSRCERPPLRDAPVPARDDVERALVAIWEEALGVTTIGVEDDFFLLGGHSLLATAIITSTRNQLGVALPVQAIFEAPTVERFADRVRALRAASYSGADDVRFEASVEAAFGPHTDVTAVQHLSDEDLDDMLDDTDDEGES
jgi:hypothetical protein